MAQPISNLTAAWLTGSGIQLNWTAASDATTGSVYDIYVLQNVSSQIPQWIMVAEGAATPVLSQATSTVVLNAPASSYFFPVSAMSALLATSGVIAKNSMAFSVIHVDSTGASSTAVSISAFPPTPHESYGASHLANNITPDAFGQLATNPQDSYEEIADSVAMFLGTVPGQRTVVPDYGIPDMPLTQIDAGEIEAALNAEEPRALASVQVIYDDNNNATLSVSISGGTEGGL